MPQGPDWLANLNSGFNQMLNSSSSIRLGSLPLEGGGAHNPAFSPAWRSIHPLLHSYSDRPAELGNRQLSAISSPRVDIGPHHAVPRRGVGGGGVAVELVQAMAHNRLDYCF